MSNSRFMKHRRARKAQQGPIRAMVSISPHGQFCFTISYTIPLQLTLFDIPGMRQFILGTACLGYQILVDFIDRGAFWN